MGVRIAEDIRNEICRSINQKASGGRFIIYDKSNKIIVVIYDIELGNPAFGRISKGVMGLNIPTERVLSVGSGIMTDWEIRSSTKNSLYNNKPIITGSIGIDKDKNDIVVNNCVVIKNQRLAIEQLVYIAP